MNMKKNAMQTIPMKLKKTAETKAQIFTASMTMTGIPSLGTPTNQRDYNVTM